MMELSSTRIFWKFAQAAAVNALLVGTAFAQNALVPPPVVSRTDFPRTRIMKEDARTKRARENAYREALKKIPNKKKPQAADPWTNMRAAEPEPLKFKRGK
jgi:hypothetical protein